MKLPLISGIDVIKRLKKAGFIAIAENTNNWPQIVCVFEYSGTIIDQLFGCATIQGKKALM